MFGKSAEFWTVVCGMVLWAMVRAESEPLHRRLVKTAASAFLAYGLSPTIAPWTRGSEVLAALGIMAVGLIVLDTATGLISDREFIKELIRRRIGGKG
ncbi:hypothetical protein KM176_05665 [Pseudooceanicola sp. CBS1P-1]|uniref:Uncharacterized protein n=1 Tax=Pseudooceanicola albus TaxID=2692189 RepID=A0A6L7FYY8_9RHOB|nr:MULTISPECIES: hypothetical protein [Pseudooceanicola]MBT9383340.1 hypothetical protein [Pseudooceanicola endophyticus]MXN16337.1 hypothetical protein [Pseudooceanicola albus]